MQVEIVNDLPEDRTITVYRCGPLVDLYLGPHIPNTAHVKVFACLRVSSIAHNQSHAYFVYLDGMFSSHIKILKPEFRAGRAFDSVLKVPHIQRPNYLRSVSVNM